MTNGLTDSRSEFFDDSSKTLGLTHRAKAPDSQVFDRGGDRLPKPGKLRDLEIAERQKIIEVEAERREDEIRKLTNPPGAGGYGMTRKQAEEIVDRETLKRGRRHGKDEAEDRRRRELETLMDARKKTHGGGSRTKARRKTGKRGTLVCTECHLECAHGCDCTKCVCGPCKAYQAAALKAKGRPTTLDHRLYGSFRESKPERAMRRKFGFGVTDSNAIVALAIQTGRQFDDVVEEYFAKCPACPDRSARVLCSRCTKVEARMRVRRAAKTKIAA